MLKRKIPVVHLWHITRNPNSGRRTPIMLSSVRSRQTLDRIRWTAGPPTMDAMIATASRVYLRAGMYYPDLLDESINRKIPLHDSPPSNGSIPACNNCDSSHISDARTWG